MIKKVRVFSLLFLLFFATTTSLLAQKTGHINSGNLISELAATKKAEKELETYQKKLVEATDKQQLGLDEKAKAFEKEYQGGKMSKVAAEERYAALQKEQEAIFKRRQEEEQKVLTKRNELVKPIFNEVEKAIQQVGKDNSYTFIFDTSIFNAILFVEESDDVSELVKKKLGL